MNDRQEILNALKLIQSVCGQYDDCTNCPFRDDDSPMPACVIQTPPTEWKIKGEEKHWKAFN